MMVRIFPYGAIQFMAFDSYKKVQYVLYYGIIYFQRAGIYIVWGNVIFYALCCYCLCFLL